MDISGISVTMASICDAIDAFSVSDASIPSMLSGRAVVVVVTTVGPSIGGGRLSLHMSLSTSFDEDGYSSNHILL